MEKQFDHKEEKKILDCMERIRFKPVESDPDSVFEKVRSRMIYGKIRIAGVSPMWKYYSVAASFALLIISAVLVFVYPKGETEHIAFLEVRATAGSKTQVVLPDSSVVWLNSNARIRYPQRFTARDREVEFWGEALFTVAKNEKIPFVVQMDGMKVQVLGTVFNIHSSAEADIIETTLLEGSVAISSGKYETKQAGRVLQPNEQALYNRVNGEIKVQRVQASLFSAWVNGIFHFENNTLEEIVRTLSRAFDVSIHIEGDTLRSKKFTAHFIHHETLDEILSVLQISAKYTYRKVKGEIYISEK